MGFNSGFKGLIKNFIFRQEIALVVGVEGNRRGVTELDAIRGIR